MRRRRPSNGLETWAEFVESLCPPIRELPAGESPGDWVEGAVKADVPKALDDDRPAVEITAPARVEDTPLLYEVQFTATAEHAELLERARALLSQRSPKIGLGDLHLQAMRLLVRMLEEQRYGAEIDDHAEPPRDAAERNETDSSSCARRAANSAPQSRQPLPLPAAASRRAPPVPPRRLCRCLGAPARAGRRPSTRALR
ncbi:MAG TPA: hypothetical protein VGQ57_06060 [Polyangiaceae bacterium]|jgi:hypothetical protein|nr:hypothetical protein [Polyangiaceae bacterium]